jgi:hypothetical protein
MQSRGFSGIFLDTLDSFQSVIKDEFKRKLYKESLKKFVKRIKDKYPNLFIITNRGFEFLDKDLVGIVNAVVAESLYTNYDFLNKEYKFRTENDKMWLLDKLNKLKSLGFKIIVIDYLPNKQKEKRREIAKKILDHGFIPFITDINLQSFGVSKCEYYPRKILSIYNDEASKDFSKTSALRLIPFILEYLGYQVVGINPDKEPLPEINDEYKGIIVWPETYTFKKENIFYEWIIKNIENNIKTVFIDFFGFSLDNEKLKKLKIKTDPNLANPDENFRVINKTDYTGFEADINFSWTDTLFESDGLPVILLENSKKQKHIPIAITEWGGYISSNSGKISTIYEMWIIDPFKFLKDSLKLDEIPAPDITTENGKRIFFSHIDGDGFKEVAVFAKKKYASEIIRDEIIKKYYLPFSVSIIEGEISSKLSKENLKFENIAKTIFSLENVEIASHSFSHPFKWRDIELKEKTQLYNLEIKGYNFDLKREIKGSADYINQDLAPKGKKTTIFFWTGDCNPSEEALKVVYQSGLLNINGGGSTMTNITPYISANFPIGIKKGEYYQIYAPNNNENTYTNLWTSNFYGYSNIIQTLKLTDKPRRLKPMNIYYHFYSGSKLSSLKALKEVYNFTLSQNPIPMFASDYILRALDFYDTVIGRDIADNVWIIKTDGNLKTLKLPFDKQKFPIITNDILGFNKYNDMLYIHLGNKNEYKLKISNTEPKTPYLKEANGIVKTQLVDRNFFKISLKGYIPINIIMKNVNNCNIKSDKPFIKNINGDETELKFNYKEVELAITCS